MPKKSLTRKEPGAGRLIPQRASQDKPFRNFMDAIPKDTLMAALSAQPESTNYRSLLVLMEAQYIGKHPPTLPALCRKANVTMPEMMNLMKDYAVAEGTVRMMLNLPQVMEDVAQDAKTRLRTCSVCKGAKTVKVEDKDDDGAVIATREEMCLNCEGEGKVRETGDRHSRDLMFESAELINKPRGPLIEQNFDMRDTLLKKVMMETQDLLEPSR